MTRTTTISIPQPCAESWEQMTPSTVGRHCAACQESVVDFTAMTDGQIVAFLAQHRRVSCGRFTPDQLDRQLLAAATPAPRWPRWLAAAAAVVGLGTANTTTVRGQSNWGLPGGMPAPTSADTTARPTITPPLTPADSVVIYGTVHNAWGLPLQASVRVHVGDTNYQARINRLGYFTVTVPAAALPATTQPSLTVSRRFFRSQSVFIELTPHRAYRFFLKRRYHRWLWRRPVTTGKFR